MWEGCGGFCAGEGVGREGSVLLYITLGCWNCYNCLLLIEMFNKNS